MKSKIFAVATLFSMSACATAATLGTFAQGYLGTLDGALDYLSDTSLTAPATSQVSSTYVESGFSSSYDAFSSIDTTSLTPVLRASSANNKPYASTAVAYAAAFQSYQYTGTMSQTITINLSLHANLLENTKIDNRLTAFGSYVTANFKVFSGDELRNDITNLSGCFTAVSFGLSTCETERASAFNAAYDIGNPATYDNGDYTIYDSVSFNVNPGDTFLIFADMQTYAPDGYSDASRTFNINFDNTSNLVALNSPISTVPVPATVWLFVSGLLGLIGVARRK